MIITRTLKQNKPFRGRLKLYVLLISLGMSLPAFSLPENGQVISGNATITTPTANTMQINQSSQNAIVDWHSFNIGNQEHVQFQQPNSSSITLNRIDGNQGISKIYGSLSANGQVWLVNPAGIWFSAGSHVDVAGLIATTAQLSRENFEAGRYIFTDSNTEGMIRNDGQIIIRNAGLLAFVGPRVVNTGEIEATMGTVVLGASRNFTVDFTGDQLINFSINGQVSNTYVDENGETKSAINQSGSIIANGGKVLLQANTASSVLDNSINMSGMVQANSVAQKNGTIILGAGGQITISGKVYARGNATGTKGGNVVVQAKKIILTDGAEVDVSGGIGGGNVNIGDLNTQTIYIDKLASIASDAVTQGSGGNVNFNAIDEIEFKGNLSAKGVDAFGGKVLFQGGSNSTVKVTGLIDTSSLYNSGVGGSIHIFGNYIGVYENALLNASGNVGGGEVLIGGEARGEGSSQRAYYTFVGALASIYADAVSSGTGGKVVVWADNATDFYGSIYARGSDLVGTGGWVETSGKIYLNVDGLVDMGGYHGGSWLLDPTDITISNSATSGAVNTTTFAITGSPNTVNINTTNIISALANGSVTIDTQTAGGNLGNVTFTTSFSFDSAGTLTVNANNNIIINSGVTITKTAGNASMTFNADNDITINGQIINNNNTGLIVNMNAGRNITIANNITSPGGGGLTISAVAGTLGTGGNITISGAGALSFITRDAGFSMSTSGVANAAITIDNATFDATGGSFFNTGSYVWASTGANGSINITNSTISLAQGGLFLQAGTSATTGGGGSINLSNVTIDQTATTVSSNNGLNFNAGSTLGAGTLSTSSANVTTNSKIVLGAGIWDLDATVASSWNAPYITVRSNTPANGMIIGGAVPGTPNTTVAQAALNRMFGQTLQIGTGGSTATNLSFSSLNLSATVATNLLLLATSGTITQTGAMTLTSSANRVLMLSGASSTSLTNASNNIPRIAGTNSLGDITIVNASTNNLTLTTATDPTGNIASVSGLTSSGDIDLTGGFITQTAAGAVISNRLDITSRTGGDFSISSSNDVNIFTLTASVSGSALLDNNGSLTLGNITVPFAASDIIIQNTGGNVSINGTLNNGLNGSGDLSVISLSSGFSITDTVSGGFSNGSGLVNFQTNDGDITLNGTNNDSILANGSRIRLSVCGAGTGACAATNTSNIVFNEISGFQLSGVRLGIGSLTIVGNGNIQQVVGTNIAQAATSGVGAVSITSTFATGNIILTESTNNFVGSVTLNSLLNASIRDANALVFGGASDVSGTLTLQTVGAITQAVGSTITVGGLTTINSGTANVTLTGNNDFSTVTITSANSVNLTDINALIMAASTIGANLTLTSTGTGNITQTGAITVAGTTNINAGAGVISFSNVNNDFTGAVTLTNTGANNVNVRDQNGIILGTASVGSGAFVVTAGGSGTITQNGATTITQAGGGAVTFTTAGGAITLTNANNFLGAVAFVGTGTSAVQINDINALALAASTIGGALTVTANGNITQTGALAITGISSFSAGAGAITLTNAGNDFTGAVSLSNSGANNVAVVDLSNIILGTSNVGTGTLTVTANGVTGNIAQNGALTQAASAGAATFNAVTGIVLTQANDFTGAVSLNSTSGNAFINDINSLILGASTLSASTNPSNLFVTANGAITQTGALNVSIDGVHLTAGAGNHITLTNVNNDVLFFRVISGNNVSLTNSGSLLFASTSTISGNLTATALAGNIGQAGIDGIIIANTPGTLATFTATGSITLTNASHDFTSVLVNGSSSVTLRDVNAFNVAGITSSGAVTLTAGTNLTDSGMISGTTLTTSTATGLVFDFGHSITSLNATNTTSGVLQFINNPISPTAALAVTNIVQNTPNGFVRISNLGTGGLNITGPVDPGTVVLDSAGAITATGQIITTNLVTQSVGGTTISNATNQIGNYAGRNTGAGNIVVINGQSLNIYTYAADGIQILTPINGIAQANGRVVIEARPGSLSLLTGASITSGAAASAATAAIVLVHENAFVNSSGSTTPFTLTNGGNYQIWGVSPTQAGQNFGGITNFAYTQYNLTFPTYPTLSATGVLGGTGSGLIYSIAPTITPSLQAPVVSKTYDGTVAATLAAGNYTSSGAINGDTITLNNPTSGSYNTANVGTGKTITATGITLVSASNGGKPVYGYSLASTSASGAIGTITAATLTYTATPVSRAYGSANPAFTGNVTGFVNGETQGTATTGTLAFTSAATAASNVGSYAINGSGLTANNGNYTFVQAAGNATALTITAATLTYTATPASRTYGAANPAFTGNVTGFVNGDTQGTATTGTLTFSSAATITSNVGSYAINGSGLTANSGNYIFAQAAGNATALTISPATLTYTATPASRTYGAANPAFTGNVTGFVNGETQGTATTGTLTFSSAATATSNVGTYAINGSGLTANNGNYTFVQAAGNATALTITPATLTYNATPVSRTYGAANPAFTGNVTGFVNGETQGTATTGTLTFSSAATATSIVGSYAINGSGLTANNGNYTFVQAAGNATALTITPATLTYTANLVSRTYGTANPALTGVVTGFVNGETQGTATTGTLSFTTAATAASNVGSYAINGSGLTANSGNYTFVQAAGNATALTINAATLTYNATPASRTYGAANPAFTGNVTGFVNGETQGTATTGTLTFSSAAIATSNVGTYAINGSGLTANNGNYIFAQAAGNATALTITAATLTYTATPASRTYGAANPVFTGNVTGFVNGETQGTATTGTLTFTSPATTASNVGTYAINGSGLTANNSNYIFVQAAGNSSALTITPATLTYNATPVSRTYGAANPAFTGNVTGFVNGQTQGTATTGTLTFTTAATTASNVGSYAINGSGLSANNGNYTFVQAAGNATALTITPATLTYTANTVSRTYGTANPAFTGVVTGFVNGQTQATATTGTLTFSSAATAASNVGSYAINGSGLTANNGNYSFVQVAGNATALTITAATLTYTATPASRTYGAANPAFTGNVTGFVNGDTQGSATTGTLTFTSPATVTSNVGSYAINGSGLTANNGNYTFVQAVGNATALTITPATLTYNATPASRAYGTANPVFTGNVTGFLNGETQGTATTGTLAFTSPATTTSNVGSYAINGSGLTANNGNYTFVQAVGNATALTITPATLTYTANPASRAYGAANPVFSGVVTGFVNGETQGTATTGTVVFTSPATTASNVGSYAINGSGLTANNGNYTFVQAAGNATALTITAATLTYTATPASRTYGAANPAFTGNVTGFLNGDTQGSATTGTLTFTSPATVTSNVGSYAINGSGLTANNGNYTFVQAAGNATALTITPATLTYAATPASRIYGDANPVFGGSVTGFLNGETQGTATTGTLTFTSPATVTSNVGNYAINGSGLTANNGNYTFVQAAGNATALTITARPLTIINVTAQNKVYDSTTAATLITGTAALSNVVNGDVITLNSGSATGVFADKNVANAIPVYGNGFTLSGSQSSNYVIATSGGNQVTTQANITPFTITATNISANDKVYDANTSAVVDATNAILTGVFLGDTVTVDTSGASGVFVDKNVGTNKNVNISGLSLGGAQAGNYVLAGTGAVALADITPATLTVTGIVANNKVYDGTTTATLSDLGTLNGVIGGDVVSINNSYTANFDNANIGNGKTVTVTYASYSLTGADAGNYVIQAPLPTTTANITQASLTITANDLTITYGPGYTFLGTEFTTIPGLPTPAGDNVTSVTLVSPGSAEYTNIGTYVITPSAAVGTGLSNYNITYVTGTLTIIKRVVYVEGVTANDKVYNANTSAVISAAGATLGNNGNPNAGVYGTDVITADTTSATGTFSDKNVGVNKTVNINGITINGTNVGNYELNNPNGFATASITPAPLTVTADSGQSKTYGQANPVYTYNATGFQGADTVGDSLTGALARTAGENVGSYAINQGTLAAQNYTITFQSENFTINPASLTITANNALKTYGSTLTFAGTEFLAAGLVNGDTVTSVTLLSAGAVNTATVIAPGPNYDITPSAAVGTGLSNYSINYVNGTLSVTPLTVTIAGITAQNKEYDATTAATISTASANITNVQFSDQVSIDASGVTAAFVNPNVGTGKTVNINNLALTGTDAGNYILANPNAVATADITPKALQVINIQANNKVYDTTIAATLNSVGVLSGVIGGDTVTLNSSSLTSTFDTAQVGTGKTVSVNGYTLGGASASNYVIDPLPATTTADITPASLTITANNNSKVYGTTVTFAGTEFTSNGLLGSDNITSVTLNSLGAPATANVGSFAIAPSNAVGSGLSNYTINYVDGTLTVTAKALTVTANSFSKVYGDTYTFTGTEFTSNGLVNSDSISSVSLSSLGAVNTANVGSYGITASTAVGTGLSNYTISYVPGSLSVTQKALLVTANNITKTYGNTVTFAGTEFSAPGLVNGDTITDVSLASLGAVSTASVAGSPYTITASNAVGSGLNNYSISYASGTLTVNPAALTITANNQSKTYGSTITFAGTEYITSGLVNSDSVSSVTLGSLGAAATATVAGSPYAITASNAVGSGLSNYTINYVDGSLTVNAKALTITADNAAKTYGSTYTFAGTEFTTNGLVNSDSVSSVTLISSGTPATANVGSYDIVASNALGSGLSNYTISYVDGSLSVDAKALTITADNASKVYGDTYNFAGTEFVATGLVNSDTVDSISLSSGGAAAPAGVGSYAINGSSALGTGISNYDITYVDGTLNVTPKALTVTADSTSKVYGNTVTFAGTEFSTAGLVNGDTVSSVNLTSAGASATANVGAYDIIASAASGSGLNNYTITYDNGTLTVTPKAATVTVNDATKTYGDTYTFNGNEFVATGLINSDVISAVNLSSTGAPATANVGSYAIVGSGATGTGVSNYTISYVDGTLNVTPKSLLITADNATKTYGSTYTFVGNEFSANGLVNSDSISGVTLVSTGAVNTAAVGPYAITASNATGSGLSNYAITYIDGTLTVTAKALTVTADAATKVYGSTYSFAGTEFSTAGLVNGDTVTSVTLLSSGAPATANVGGYAITASDAIGSGLSNYTINYVDNTLTVTPKTLTVTASDASKVYGSTLSFAGTEFSSAGLVNSDSISSVTLISAGTPATANAGSYAITGSNAIGNGLSNYTINYVDGTLSVTPKAVSVTANDASKVYGNTATFTGSEFSTNGLVNGDTISSVSLSSLGAPPTANVGTYAIAASNAVGTGLSNYTITYNDGNLTVTPKALTVTANDTSKVYGSTVTFLGSEFTANGLVNTDSISSVSLSSTGAAATAGVAGSPYAIVASNATGSGLSNYTISYVDGSLTVTPKTLTITANDTSKTYGNLVTFNGTEFVANGLVNTDTVSGVDLSSVGAPVTAPVGSFAINASNAVGTGLSNYTINYASGTLTVTPKSITVTANNQTKTYGSSFTFVGNEYSALGLINGDSISEVTLISGATASTANVGSYTITPSAAIGNGLANYTISYVDGTFSVTPASLTINVNDSTKVYGNTYTFSSSDYTVIGLLNSDAVSSVTVVSAGAAATADVGNYVVNASNATGTGVSNYTITYNDGSLTVTPRTLTVSNITANNKVYDGNANATINTGTAALIGIVNGDTVVIDTTSAFGQFQDQFVAGDARNAGVNKPVDINGIAITGIDSGNYVLVNPNASTTATITPAPITVTATASTIREYDGTTNTYAIPTITSGTIVGPDFASSPLTQSFADMNVGVNKTITPSTLIIADGNGGNNYQVTYVTATGTITPYSLNAANITATKVYDGTNTATLDFSNAILQAVLPIDSANVTWVTTGYSATYSSTNAGSSIVINYTPVLSVTGVGASNYQVVQPTITGSITQAPLTVTANNATKVYDAALYTGGAGVNYTGFVAGESAANLSGTLIYVGTAEGARNVGQYTLAPTGLTSSNYAINFVTGTLTVSPAPLTTSGIVANSKVYDGNNSATLNMQSANLNGVYSGDAVLLNSSNYQAFFASDGPGTNIPVTVSQLLLSGADAGNYVLLDPSSLFASITGGSVVVIPPRVTPGEVFPYEYEVPNNQHMGDSLYNNNYRGEDNSSDFAVTNNLNLMDCTVITKTPTSLFCPRSGNKTAVVWSTISAGEANIARKIDNFKLAPGQVAIPESIRID